jgi:2-dehydro-3-deoxyphosphogluconate aldolase/(4S)-4-hydroxy-2-oxoglutarate aldolase
VARFRRLQVLNAINEIGVVPVFYNGNLDAVQNIVRACAAGGIRVLEFTNRGDHAWEVFSELEKYCATEVPDAILGAGSVLEPATAAMYINSGANFIVGPVTNPEVARLCNRRKVSYTPGAGTASEVSAAEELGCEIIKVFPGSGAGGPGFVKDLLGPMPWSSIMPTGGVNITRESLAGWFDAGVVAVGMGSKLVSADVIKNRDWDTLEERSRQVVATIQEIRNGN